MIKKLIKKYINLMFNSFDFIFLDIFNIDKEILINKNKYILY